MAKLELRPSLHSREHPPGLGGDRSAACRAREDALAEAIRLVDVPERAQVLTEEVRERSESGLSEGSRGGLLADGDRACALRLGLGSIPRSPEMREEVPGRPACAAGQPLGRLTDQEWKAMLEAGDEPPRPQWTSRFVR